VMELVLWCMETLLAHARLNHAARADLSSSRAQYVIDVRWL
jgi:hypothetical protein